MLEKFPDPIPLKVMIADSRTNLGLIYGYQHRYQEANEVLARSTLKILQSVDQIVCSRSLFV